MNLAAALAEKAEKAKQQRPGLGAPTTTAADLRALVARKGFVAGTELALAQIRAWDTNPQHPDDTKRRAVARDVLLLSLGFAEKAEQLLRQGADRLQAGVAVVGGVITDLFAWHAADNLRETADGLAKTRARYAQVQVADPAFFSVDMRDLKAANIEILTAARKGFIHFDEFRASLLGKLATLGIATVDLLGAIIDLAATLLKALAVAAKGIGVLAKILLYGAPVILVGLGGYWLYTKVGDEKHRRKRLREAA